MEDSQGPVPGGDVSPAERPASPPRHRRAISVAAILLLLAAGAGAWYWFNHHLAGVTAGTPAPGPPPVTVAKPVVHNIVEGDEFVGRFEAVDEVAIRSRVSGYLDQVHFKDGAIVNKGDLLFTIDQRPYQAAFDAAKSQLDVAKPACSNSTKTQFTRAEALSQIRQISELATVDDRRREYLAAAGADAGRHRCTWSTAGLNLEFTEIRAPLAGRIGRQLVSVGNLVQRQSTHAHDDRGARSDRLLFRHRRALLFRLRPRWRCSGERRAGGRRQRLEVRMVASPTARRRGFKGKLDFAENRIDNATGTMRVRASFANADGVLQPGMFGRINVPGSLPSSAACWCPTRRSAPTRTGASSMWSDDAGMVRPSRCAPARKLDGYRVIREGLTGDETIIINGLVRGTARQPRSRSRW